jgi:acyl dehydratase
LKVIAMGLIYFEDINVGDSWTSSSLVVDREEMLAYNRANDPWPIHVDAAAAARSPFGSLTASGGYTITVTYRLGAQIWLHPDRTWANLGGLEWNVKFREAVRPGDRLRVRYTITDKRQSSKPGRGVVKGLIETIDDNDRVVMSIDSVVLTATR